MATFTPDKVSRNSNVSASEIPVEGRNSELDTGPVARLLARVSKWSSDYAEYQMENGVWRKIAI